MEIEIIILKPPLRSPGEGERSSWFYNNIQTCVECVVCDLNFPDAYPDRAFCPCARVRAVAESLLSGGRRCLCALDPCTLQVDGQEFCLSAACALGGTGTGY